MGSDRYMESRMEAEQNYGRVCQELRAAQERIVELEMQLRVWQASPSMNAAGRLLVAEVEYLREKGWTPLRPAQPGRLAPWCSAAGEMYTHTAAVLLQKRDDAHAEAEERVAEKEKKGT